MTTKTRKAPAVAAAGALGLVTDQQIGHRMNHTDRTIFVPLDALEISETRYPLGWGRYRSEFSVSAEVEIDGCRIFNYPLAGPFEALDEAKSALLAIKKGPTEKRMGEEIGGAILAGVIFAGVMWASIVGMAENQMPADHGLVVAENAHADR